MSQRKIGKSPALAAPYGCPTDADILAKLESKKQAWAQMVAAMGRPPADLQFVGMDMASGRDQSAMALATRSGTHVVVATGENPSVDREWLNGLVRKARELLA